MVLDWIAWVTNLLILAEMGKRMECMVVLEGTGTSGGLRVVGKGQWNVVWMVVLEEIGNLPIWCHVTRSTPIRSGLGWHPRCHLGSTHVY